MKKIKAQPEYTVALVDMLISKIPTGAYSNLRLFATDGTLTSSDKTKPTIASDVSAQMVFDSYIKKFISDDELINCYYKRFANTFTDLKTVYTGNNTFTWNLSTQYPNWLFSK